MVNDPFDAIPTEAYPASQHPEHELSGIRPPNVLVCKPLRIDDIWVEIAPHEAVALLQCYGHK